MIDPDAVLGVLHALAEDVERVERSPLGSTAVDLLAYRDRIVALAESVGICGDPAPGARGVACDLDAGHGGLHSGLMWEGPADTVIAPVRGHWGFR